MLCAVCNKESKNQRVCPYCFTPYAPNAAPAPRASGMRAAAPAPSSGGSTPGGASSSTPLNDALAAATAALQRGWRFYLQQTPVVRYASAGILGVLLLWMFTGEEPAFVDGAVPSAVVATPIQRDEALALIRQTRETAIVDVQQDEVFVSYPASTFPVREEGQIALAQQFAQADEIVEGRKRRIFFYNPNGKMFAQSDGVRGVQVVK